jgi:hypothetical protein
VSDGSGLGAFDAPEATGIAEVSEAAGTALWVFGAAEVSEAVGVSELGGVSWATRAVADAADAGLRRRRRPPERADPG